MDKEKRGNKMILKYSFKRDNNRNNLYKYVDCELLKCDVKNVAYFKENLKGVKYTAFDIDSGLLITRGNTVKELINKVNDYKEKIENARNCKSYKNMIEENENAIAINSIEEVKQEIMTIKLAKKKSKKR